LERVQKSIIGRGGRCKKGNDFFFTGKKKEILAGHQREGTRPSKARGEGKRQSTIPLLRGGGGEEIKSFIMKGGEGATFLKKGRGKGALTILKKKGGY